ncbi:LD-carboxypeptidase [Rhizobium ruizarguesonis]|uniref:S66 family peptidase n=1 Tax=Rhizobium ruizarguesonis TaxID=2081791 RepID=UPI001030982F|nr:S66 peptidase family protein [Rhizobium ruizarguesonis]TBE45441.1 LD-carboxypeptidase [Rhizobium ruizarguesonis]
MNDAIHPRRLGIGSHVRVVAPARSLSIISPNVREIADAKLAEMGLTRSYGQRAEFNETLSSADPRDRVLDLEEAFADPSVDAIFTSIGGFNSIELLKMLDFVKIARSPKIICGYSDITVMVNAIHAMTGMVTYYGPHYSSLGMRDGNEFTLSYLRACLFSDEPFTVEASPRWSQDAWFINQDDRTFEPNPGIVVIQPGEAEGRLAGGNINAFRLLNGTRFAPSLNGALLFLENDGLDKDMTPVEFNRRLETILLQRGGDTVKGLIIGRFKTEAKMSIEQLTAIIASKEELAGKPVIAGVDFGHTMPMITIPIGGTARVTATRGEPRFEIIRH